MKLSKAELKRFAKFAVVGVSNTVIDLALFNILLALHFNIYAATSIAFLFAVTNSYFFNRHWTFSDRKAKNMWRQYLHFIGVATVGLALNNLIVWLCLHLLHITNPFIKANIIRIAAIAVIVFWNYGVSRFVVFKAKDKEEAAEELVIPAG